MTFPAIRASGQLSIPSEAHYKAGASSSPRHLLLSLQKENHIISRFLLIMSRLLFIIPIQMVSQLQLTEFRITMETHLWVCLKKEDPP